MSEVIVIPEGKICDYIDGKFRNDTPEEYVRQNIEKRLVNEHKYTKDRIAVEFTLRVGSRKPRADIVIFSADVPERSQEHDTINLNYQQLVDNHVFVWINKYSSYIKL